ncbi:MULTISPECIES: response regulator [Gordonia]|uniref:Response regulator transcription factor n=2 Tax=Gordonia TaxID=2053 RepID=A0ABN3HF20_9ACTN|nr:MULTISPECIES: response regulator transcription factor [Gordonia]AUH69642.1 DNA-binding response regulator [Gordonia sp. YC-JH1]KJR05831.1 LuxR family transcriptional regulator [Gordonia sihwensis]KXT57465.1 LuxR family transcriptional regulator [Gordonia sp. QH-12]MBY4570266.1 DNA-binding response regulator [Gordonia sihwensis]WFN93782.1 response regulator transcription factor [Gordonia sihwensis]
MIRIMLVDDHPVVRAGLRAVLGASPDLDVVAEAGTADEAIALAGELSLDVVLMDLRLHGTETHDADGVYATQSIRRLADPPQVLILTTYESDADIVRSVSAGAVGYLLKDAAPETLISAIRSAAAGETVLGPAVAARLLTRVTDSRPALTARELEIVEHLDLGLSNREIAKRLFISEATVKSHLVHIFDKLGVSSRSKVVAVARQRGLIG